jgi:hypothetical protein
MIGNCLCGKVEAEEVCLDSDDEDPPPPPSRPAHRIDPPAHRYTRPFLQSAIRHSEIYAIGNYCIRRCESKKNQKNLISAVL